MATPVQLRPGRRDFNSISAVRQVFPELKLPTTVPSSATFALALWQYPPLFTTREVNGQTEVVSTNYNIAPTLGRGHVKVVYKVGNGSLVISQGTIVPFGNPNNPQAGAAVTRQLRNGRTVFTRMAQGAQFPLGRMHIVSWVSGKPAQQFVVWSNVLAIDELVAVAETIP